jgi:Ca2+-binding RTX toxin-like protein
MKRFAISAITVLLLLLGPEGSVRAAPTDPCDSPEAYHVGYEGHIGDSPNPSGGGALYGSSGDDILCGSPGSDLLVGGGGNDTLVGYGSNTDYTTRPICDSLIGGPGDDTYHVPMPEANPCGRMMERSWNGDYAGGVDDEGNNILSYELWTRPWPGMSCATVNDLSSPWYGLPHDPSSFVRDDGRWWCFQDPTTMVVSYSYRLTYHDDDVVNYHPDDISSIRPCAFGGSMTIHTLGGDDWVNCSGGTFYLGSGNDRATGGLRDSPSMVYAGGGNDTVKGSPARDTIDLGPGNDIADVRLKGSDIVRGGHGADKAYASTNDQVFSARRLR